MAKAILFLEFCVALLMGLEYVLNRGLNSKLNEWLEKVFIIVENHTLFRVKNELSFASEKEFLYWFLVSGIATLAIVLGRLDILFFSVFLTDWSVFFLAILSVYFIVALFVLAFYAIPIFPFFLIFFILLRVVRSCPKGSVGGLGFFLLMVVFLLKYINIT